MTRRSARHVRASVQERMALRRERRRTQGPPRAVVPESQPPTPTAREVYLAARKKMKEARAVYDGAQTALGNTAAAYYREAGIGDFQPPENRESGMGRPETREHRGTLPWYHADNLKAVLVGGIFLLGLFSVPYWLLRLLF